MRFYLVMRESTVVLGHVYSGDGDSRVFGRGGREMFVGVEIGCRRGLDSRFDGWRSSVPGSARKEDERKGLNQHLVKKRKRKERTTKTHGLFEGVTVLFPPATDVAPVRLFVLESTGGSGDLRRPPNFSFAEERRMRGGTMVLVD